MGASREVVVVSGVRTAIGDYGGSLKDFPLVDLAASVVAESIKRADFDASKIGQVVMGNVIHTDPRDMYIFPLCSCQRRDSDRNSCLHSKPSLWQRPSGNRLCGSINTLRRYRNCSGRRCRINEPFPILASKHEVGTKNE